MFRLYHIKCQVAVIAKSNNVYLDQSVVLVWCEPHPCAICIWMYTSAHLVISLDFCTLMNSFIWGVKILHSQQVCIKHGHNMHTHSNLMLWFDCICFLVLYVVELDPCNCGIQFCMHWKIVELDFEIYLSYFYCLWLSQSNYINTNKVDYKIIWCNKKLLFITFHYQS